MSNGNGLSMGEEFALTPDHLIQTARVTPRKVLKRQKHFVQVPMVWVDRLEGASGHTWHLAMHLLYLNWKGRGGPIKLANGMLGHDGISRATKWRALRELERRGLVAVECRPSRSPIVQVFHL